MTIQISLEGLQTLAFPETRALAHLKIEYNNQLYNWTIFIPPGEDLGTYIESQKLKIQNDIDAKEAKWAALEPKTRTIPGLMTGEEITVDIQKEEIVKPDNPDYYAARRAEYPNITDQLDAIWKGPESAAYQEMVNKILEIKSKYPKD
jgi:hypothetical protein